MNAIHIRIPADERRCEVDTADLEVWSKALLDDILFETAKHMSMAGAADPIASTITFRISVDRDDGSIVIER